jgi:GT2 family glycosyltransferase
VIVVSWNTRDVLRACLASVCERLALVPHELLVVDNASSDGSAEMVAAEFPQATLIRNSDNQGFGRGANAGMRAARGDDLLLLNSDCELLDDSLVALRELLHRAPEIGLVGPRLLLGNGQLQASARRFPSVGRLILTELFAHRLMSRQAAGQELLGHYWDHDREQLADWLVGACLLLKRQVFEQTSGFDASIFMYGEEVEWCQRIRAAGWTILFSPVARVRHLNHQSADRLFGDEGRTDRCLLAENDLLRRWQGGLAPWLADSLRISGALARLILFRARSWLRPADAYARDVQADARALLAHYARRWRGRTWKAPA